MKTITAEKLKRKLDSNYGIVLVNVLAKELFEKVHIPGSINIPLEELEMRALGELPDKSQDIIVYCASLDCQASPKAMRLLERLGYKNVSDFEEGIEGWEQEGYILEGTEAQ